MQNTDFNPQQELYDTVNADVERCMHDYEYSLDLLNNAMINKSSGVDYFEVDRRQI